MPINAARSTSPATRKVGRRASTKTIAAVRTGFESGVRVAVRSIVLRGTVPRGGGHGVLEARLVASMVRYREVLRDYLGPARAVGASRGWRRFNFVARRRADRPAVLVLGNSACGGHRLHRYSWCELNPSSRDDLFRTKKVPRRIND